MENIIQVLPDHVANQIAAGEVIQRPASVVKELVENAIDAGASQIDVLLKEAGRNMIRVSDNGKGMSPADARLAFDRHATSKIRQATDLFHLHTMGFRGEALASIASVAQVELVTRRSDDELAWKVEIEGSVVSNEEPTLAAQGSRFTVRNLFFNIPARRKFLGDNTKELKAIREEFIQIALVNPQLHLTLTHNDDVLYLLPPSNLKQRILNIFGKRNGGQLHKQLYPVDVQTQLIHITGFIGDPTAACMRDQMQFFFVNNRFIRHKNFRSAVMKAFELLIPSGQQPTYFLYFEVEPEALDVNIHPTKTEVKFEHESAIWPILHATVREALGKANAVPSIDFDRDDAPDIRVFTGDRDVVAPHVKYDPSYNPFRAAGTGTSSTTKSNPNWDELFKGFEKRKPSHQEDAWDVPMPPDEPSTPLKESPADTEWQSSALLFGSTPLSAEQLRFQWLNSYLVLQTPVSLVFIDQHRAHFTLLYHRFLQRMEIGKPHSQTLLFPEILNLDVLQRITLLESMDDLHALGFQVRCEETDFWLEAIPADVENIEPSDLLLELLSTSEVEELPMRDRKHVLALRLARSASIPNGRKLSETEQKDLVERWLALAEFKYTPEGKTVFTTLTSDEILKRLSR